MIDQVVAPELPLVGGTQPIPEPIAATTNHTPIETSPAPVPTEAPAAPIQEPIAAEPSKTVAETPTLLEEVGGAEKAKEAPKSEEKPIEAKTEEKSVEVKPSEKPSEVKTEDKAAEVKGAEPVKLEPVNYEYSIPDTIKMDEALKGSFHTALDSFRADPAKGAQPLIDLHNQAMADYANHIAAEQQRIFAETRKAWRTEVMSDPQLGGSGYNTTMKAIARMRDLAVPEKDRASFSEFLRVTGAGDHPAFLRAMHNFARYFDEPSLPPSNPTPPPTNGRAPGSRARILYDNPRSSNSGRQ